MGIAYAKKHVYAFEMGSGLVKIGVSYSVDQRAYHVSRKNADKVTKIFNTSLFSSKKASAIEKACHLAFANKRAFGEFFKISFTEACQKINEYADSILEKSIVDTSQIKSHNPSKLKLCLGKTSVAVPETLKTSKNNDFDVNKLTVAEKIKRIASYRGIQLAQLGNEYNQLYGTKYSAQSFRNKLNNGSLTFCEVEKIGSILGFNVDISLKD